MDITAIDEVIDELGAVVAWARREGHRAGYFASLYRKVTIAVKSGILDGRFQNAAMMTELDVVFARRYLDAHSQWRSGRPTTGAWRAAFEAAARWRPLVVQHLLAGMNAHINLDLGIAAATVAPGDRIGELQADFYEINALLADLIRSVIDDIASVSPWIGMLDKIGGRTQDSVVRFSIDVARDEAWRFAQTLATLVPADQSRHVDARDRWTADFSKTILRPGRFLPIGVFIIRLRESNDVVEVIDVLAD